MRAIRTCVRPFAWLAVALVLAVTVVRPAAAAPTNVVYDDVLGAMVICNGGHAQSDEGSPAGAPQHCPACTAAVAFATVPTPPALAVRIAFALPPAPRPAPQPIPAAPAPTELGSRAPPQA